MKQSQFLKLARYILTFNFACSVLGILAALFYFLMAYFQQAGKPAYEARLPLSAFCAQGLVVVCSLLAAIIFFHGQKLVKCFELKEWFLPYTQKILSESKKLVLVLAALSLLHSVLRLFAVSERALQGEVMQGLSLNVDTDFFTLNMAHTIGYGISALTFFLINLNFITSLFVYMVLSALEAFLTENRKLKSELEEVV